MTPLQKTQTIPLIEPIITDDGQSGSERSHSTSGVHQYLSFLPQTVYNSVRSGHWTTSGFYLCCNRLVTKWQDPTSGMYYEDVIRISYDTQTRQCVSTLTSRERALISPLILEEYSIVSSSFSKQYIFN